MSSSVPRALRIAPDQLGESRKQEEKEYNWLGDTNSASHEVHEENREERSIELAPAH